MIETVIKDNLNENLNQFRLAVLETNKISLAVKHSLIIRKYQKKISEKCYRDILNQYPKWVQESLSSWQNFTLISENSFQL